MKIGNFDIPDVMYNLWLEGSLNLKFESFPGREGVYAYVEVHQLERMLKDAEEMYRALAEANRSKP